MMMKGKAFLFILFLLSSTVCTVEAQKQIKINGEYFNKLDKKNRKQGGWIFFDTSGFVRLTTSYEDDKSVTPLVFYENSDTAFIRFPKKDNAELFICYDNNIPVSGSYVYEPGSAYTIEIDSAYTNNSNILQKVKAYHDIGIQPVYMFKQSKLIDYLSAAHNSSDFVFNNSVYVVLHLTAQGIVNKVEFPADKNFLYGIQQRELEHIYKTMSRWQPLFIGNTTKESIVVIANNHTLSIFGERDALQ